MTRWFVLLLTALSLLFAGNASASCTYQYITLPDGRTILCQTCCSGSTCQSFCN